ncbi:phage terminase small subunit [Enterococcus casseliflavus]|uniref:phage terminase small subunit n=1 Tax=Enterococcus casseliflavus TaxID=37734 RepID=UPI002DB7309E|nr:phage terminase small subunit [Enterococcus casseliflavus]MEB6086733.1 phage terminase small subunit [Enterococcus casseliflavus]
MARKRDPRRDEAFLIYEKNGGKIALVKIANILGLPPGTIRGWRSKDRWDEKLNGTFQSKGTERSKKTTERSKRVGAPDGNQNARGNKGNSRASPPSGNKNALKTGEFETIFEDVLSDEEKDIYSNLSDDPFFVLSEEIKLLKIRQRRMMHRVKDAEEGLNPEEIERLQQLRKVKEPTVVDGKVVTIKREVLKDVQVSRKQFRKIDNILAIEDALTRISNQVTKAIKQLNELSLSNGRVALLEEQKRKMTFEADILENKAAKLVLKQGEQSKVQGLIDIGQALIGPIEEDEEGGRDESVEVID